jgi:hypothetical protein
MAEFYAWVLVWNVRRRMRVAAMHPALDVLPAGPGGDRVDLVGVQRRVQDDGGRQENQQQRAVADEQDRLDRQQQRDGCPALERVTLHAFLTAIPAARHGVPRYTGRD